MAEEKKAVRAKQGKEAKAKKKAVAETKKTKHAAEKHPAKKHTEKGKEKHPDKGKEKQAEKGKEKHAEKGKEKQAEKGKEKHSENGKTAGKDVKAAKKPYVKKKLAKITKSKEVKKLSLLVRAKKRHMFRGRFGKRSVRKVSREKWQKWRKPRGIDIYFNKEDGLVPGTGYRTPKKIRFIHPSGYEERLVRNMDGLLAIEKEKGKAAARISRTIGKKKKKEILKKADELKIVVLNR